MYWTNAFISIFIHASLLRSACFPLMYHGDNWKEKLNEEMKVQQKNFEEITETVDKKMKNLWDNRMTNAYRFLPIILDTLWQDSGDCELMYAIYLHLNTNFHNGANLSTKFNSIIVNSTNVNYQSPDLFYYSKSDNRSIVVGIGPILTEFKYNCNEGIDNVVKNLTCFKIGDSHISYRGERVQSKIQKSCYQ